MEFFQRVSFIVGIINGDHVLYVFLNRSVCCIMAEDKFQKRSGSTVVTSVSVSEQFQKLLAEYNLSPTECFRRGVAVTLCDLGIGMYQSQKNEDRLKYVQEFMKKMEEDEKLSEQFAKIELFEKAQKQLNELKKIMQEIEG